jgi:hypothetical protein
MIDQPQSEFWHWLYTNAPAAWIAALVATVSLILVQVRRHRPKRLVVRELPSVSFLNVAAGMRHRITTTFDDRQINALVAVAYDVYNEGSDPIRNAAFTLALPRGAFVLNAAIRPRDSEPICEWTGADNLVKVSLPYVNPFREHKQLLRLLVLADGETHEATISGSGEGWSVRYVPLPGPGYARKLQISAGLAGVVIGAASAAYIDYVISHTQKTRPSVFTAKILLATAATIAVAGAVVWFYKQVLSRTLSGQDRSDDQ